MDCGLFSIAIATSLLHGLSPGLHKQSLLQPNLISCFENILLVALRTKQCHLSHNLLIT